MYNATLQLPYQSVEVWRKRLQAEGTGHYHLVAVADGEPVGLIGLHTNPARPRIAHTGELGMSVAEEWQGRGVGAKLMEAALELADNWLNLRRIELEVFVDNDRAIRLYERFGFEREGTKRMHALRNGQYVDAHMMARLRKGA